MIIGTKKTALFTAPGEVTNMILISGNDTIVDGLCSALDSLGRPYRRVDKARMSRWFGARTFDASMANHAPAPD